MTGFKDHFSGRSAGYAVYRPTYPPALFEWLASLAPRREVAWDCATGSGQAAEGLVGRFERIIATDASPAQLAHARPLPGVEYRVAPAEASGLPDRSVDLITVAQALHWLDRPRFFAEAARVARPGAVLACWMYRMMRLESRFDAVVERLYTEIVGPWWPGERGLVEQDYRPIALPWPELVPPPFAMTARWNFEQTVGYLRTWSAVTRYLQANDRDPVALVEAELAAAWGDRNAVREISWPLVVRVARIGAETGPGTGA